MNQEINLEKFNILVQDAENIKNRLYSVIERNIMTIFKDENPSIKMDIKKSNVTGVVQIRFKIALNGIKTFTMVFLISCVLYKMEYYSMKHKPSKVWKDVLKLDMTFLKIVQNCNSLYELLLKIELAGI
jgi:hypothetical protein